MKPPPDAEQLEPLPRLRPLEVFRTVMEGREVIALRDPSGATEKVALLPPAVAMLLGLLNGRSTVADVQAEVMRRTGELVFRAQIEQIVRQLDEALLLDSPRFAAHVAEIERHFSASPTRAAVHAGKAYPAEPEALRSMLDGFFPPASEGPHAPRAILAPHIDFARGAPVYGRAYQSLRGAAAPDLFVVFGTDHNAADFRFTLTRKHYETPAGTVHTDIDLVDQMVRGLGADGLFVEEMHHRTEHSIEFQAVMIRHVFPCQGVRILPVLCGSMHRLVADGSNPRGTDEAERFLSALAAAVQGRRVCWIAGADLAHVGPRFGDTRPFDTSDREELREADDELLDRVTAGDADGFFSAVARAGDRHRICGTSAIYAMLRMVHGASGRLVAYDQCPAAEDGGSLVSIASAIFDG